MALKLCRRGARASEGNGGAHARRGGGGNRCEEPAGIRIRNHGSKGARMRRLHAAVLLRVF